MSYYVTCHRCKDMHVLGTLCKCRDNRIAELEAEVERMKMEYVEAVNDELKAKAEVERLKGDYEVFEDVVIPDGQTRKDFAETYYDAWNEQPGVDRQMQALRADVERLRAENAKMENALGPLIEYARESAKLSPNSEHSRFLSKWADVGEAAKAAGGKR